MDDDLPAAVAVRRRRSGTGEVDACHPEPAPARLQCPRAALHRRDRGADDGDDRGFWPPGVGDASAVAAAGPAGSWGRAIGVPGLAALNTGGLAEVMPRVMRLGGQLRGRRVLLHAQRRLRGSWPSSGTASGHRRPRCPAWRP